MEQVKELIKNNIYQNLEDKSKIDIKAKEYFNSHYQYLIKLLETRPDDVEAYLDKSIKKFLLKDNPVKVKEQKKPRILKFNFLTPEESKLYHLYKVLKKEKRENEITPDMRQTVNKYHKLYYKNNIEYKQKIIDINKAIYREKTKFNKPPLVLDDKTIIYKGITYEITPKVYTLNNEIQTN